MEKTVDMGKTVLTRSVEEMHGDLVNLYTQKNKAVEKIKELSRLEHRTKFSHSPTFL